MSERGGGALATLPAACDHSKHSVSKLYWLLCLKGGVELLDLTWIGSPQ